MPESDIRVKGYSGGGDVDLETCCQVITCIQSCGDNGDCIQSCVSSYCGEDAAECQASCSSQEVIQQCFSGGGSP